MPSKAFCPLAKQTVVSSLDLCVVTKSVISPKEAIKYAALLLSAAVLLGCNMGTFAPNSQTSPSSEVLAAKKKTAQVTGGWEIVATSNQTTSTINETRVETQFSESKNGKLTGSPTRVFGLVYPLGHDLFFLNSFQVGGLC